MEIGKNPTGINPENRGMIMKAKVYQNKDKRLKSERWIVILYWNGKHHKRYHYDERGTPIETKAMAERIAHRINADIEAKGKSFDTRAWFRTADNEFYFENYVLKWYERKGKTVSNGYAIDLKGCIHNYFIPFFGKKDIRTLRYGDFEDFLYWLPDKLKVSTKNKLLIILKSLFNDACKREDIFKVPAFPKVNVPEPEFKWLDAEWQAKVINAIPERDRPIFQFMAYYGCRPSEARALQWSDVDFEKKTITIRRNFSKGVLVETTKTKAIKYLPVTSEIETLLKSLPTRGIGATFVFLNSRGKHYHPLFSKIWDRATKVCGAPRVTMYQGVKHSTATNKLREGWNLQEVAELLGHKDLKSTQKYAKVTQGHLRDKLEQKTNDSESVLYSVESPCE